MPVLATYKKVKKCCANARISSKKQYDARYKSLPCNAPKHPDKFYAGNGWLSWNLFVHTNSRPIVKWASYKEVVAANKRVGFKTKKQYLAMYPGLPCKAPSAPSRIYRDKWQGWDKFLGL